MHKYAKIYMIMIHSHNACSLLIAISPCLLKTFMVIIHNVLPLASYMCWFMLVIIVDDHNLHLQHITDTYVIALLADDYKPWIDCHNAHNYN